MKLEIEFYDTFCATKKFLINDIPAQVEEFGVQYDDEHENVKGYGCSNMRFYRDEPDPITMEKYHLSESEWEALCDLLEENLSFGTCSYCEE